MGNNDEAFTRSLLCLAMVIIIVGISTHSFMKMLMTYLVGLLGISGVLLPDWEFFDRDVSQWTNPLTIDNGISPNDVLRPKSRRFRFYPMRTVIYAVVYSFGLYKWWKYVTH